MAIANKDYVSTSGVGSLGCCQEIGNRMTRFIRDFDGGRRRIFLTWQVYGSRESVESEYIEEDVVGRVLAAASEVFPLLGVNFTYDPDSVPDSLFLKAEEEFGLVLIKASRSATKSWLWAVRNPDGGEGITANQDQV